VNSGGRPERTPDQSESEAAGPGHAAPMSTADVTASPPGTRGRINVPAADGFRGLAATAVISYHCLYAAGLPRLHSPLVRDILAAGYMGVDFFFVLSGFLLFLPVASAGGKFGSVKSYSLRRVARILPAYYLALLVTQLFDPLFVKVPRGYPVTSLRGLESLLLHATFLQHSVGLSLGFSEGFGINGAVWTLSIEALFYLILPLVAVRYFRHPFWGLAGALVLAMGWRVASSHLWLPLPHLPVLMQPKLAKLVLITQFPTYVAHFALGMTAAWIFVRLRRDRVVVPAWFLVAAQAVALTGIIWAMASAGGGDIAGTTGPLHNWAATTPVAMCFAVLLLSTALAPPWAQFPVRNRAVRRLGDISYGAYLWHLLFIGFALQTLHWVPDGTNSDFARMFAFAFAGALAAGWASYRFIEQPAIRWARRRSRSRSATPAPPDRPARRDARLPEHGEGRPHPVVLGRVGDRLD
jgi:peptidoglycan/LPS O-acetylase OafA/YrhL